MDGFQLVLLSILLSVFSSVGAYTDNIIQHTQPVPLRRYKSPRSVIYGRATVPDFSVSTEFHISIYRPPGCKVPNILWELAHERYPFINFRNGSHPPDVFIPENDVSVILNDSMRQVSVVQQYPLFGDVFWGVIINEPYTNSVKQAGIGSSGNCFFKSFISQVSVVQERPVMVIADGQHFAVELSRSSSSVYSFKPEFGVISIRLEVVSCVNANTTVGWRHCPVLVLFERNRVPSDQVSHASPISIVGDPLDNSTWSPLRTDGLNFFRVFNTHRFSSVRAHLRLVAVHRCDRAPQPDGNCVMWPQMNRFTDFMNRFQYRFSYFESSLWTVIHMRSHRYITSFRVRPGEDQGGTLTAAIQASAMESLDGPPLPTEVRVFGCISTAPMFASESDRCIYRLTHSSASNRFSSQSHVHIPYPAVGMWYFTIWRECFNADERPVHCTNDSTVSFYVSSQPCINSSCGRYGSCTLVSSRDLSLGACKCKWGYTGFTCTDDRYAVSMTDEMTNLVLLTLSNIFFLPAIVIALKRHYFVQALVYCYTMFSSTFYHLCDSSTPYSVCILPYDSLSFCDFYGAIMAIWVTLVAMAKLSRGLAEIAYTTAALGLVIGVETNRHSLLAFLVPLLIGLTLVAASWVRVCCLRHECYPHKRWWFLGFLPGVILSGLGLLMFAFLETSANYGYIHSLWHVLISLSIVFLLPWEQGPPLWQRGAFFRVSIIKNRSCRTSQLTGEESPLDDGEGVSMVTGRDEEHVNSNRDANLIA